LSNAALLAAFLVLRSVNKALIIDTVLTYGAICGQAVLSSIDNTCTVCSVVPERSICFATLAHILLSK
jgi:hypothetical protein